MSMHNGILSHWMQPSAVGMSSSTSRDVAFLAAGAVVGAAIQAIAPTIWRAVRTGTGSVGLNSDDDRQTVVESKGDHDQVVQETVQQFASVHRAPLRLALLPAKVAQSELAHGRGDALRACVASLFGLGLLEVPDFLTDADGYDAAIAKFVEGTGWAVVKVSLVSSDSDDKGAHSAADTPKQPDVPDGQLVVLRGKSPRGAHGHVVVARASKNGTFALVADPHPR